MKKANILIVSGFLGSGKTSFIKKYIQDSENLEKTVIIENEFGEVSIDGEILKKEGLDVKEINSGCICCSVSGNFRDSIKTIKKSFDPDTIIIEPSGIAKLSEIEDICCEFPDSFKILKKITIVDPTLYMMYVANFGGFYIDQIKNADIILFSRFSKFINDGNNLNEIRNDISSKNNFCYILANEWDSFDSLELIHKTPFFRHSYDETHLHSHECFSEDQHIHSQKCSCKEDHIYSHEHLDSGTFESLTIRSSKIFNKRQLEDTLEIFNSKKLGNIIRAKGTVRSKDSFFRLNFVPSEINIEEDNYSENSILVIIGENINKEYLSELF